MESELFGYEKGAFTGASTSGKTGRFELAQDGTLFLDEIGDLHAEAQAKILRFLQEREIQRVGGTQTLRLDVRIIAATNQDLESNIQQGHFREDLYYRLNVMRIHLPPLRERKEDIPLFALHFINIFNQEFGRKILGLMPNVEQKLIEYNWPGNIRELKNVIERAVHLSKGLYLSEEHIKTESGAPSPALAPTPWGPQLLLRDMEREYVKSVLDLGQGKQEPGGRDSRNFPCKASKNPGRRRSNRYRLARIDPNAGTYLRTISNLVLFPANFLKFIILCRIPPQTGPLCTTWPDGPLFFRGSSRTFSHQV